MKHAAKVYVVAVVALFLAGLTFVLARNAWSEFNHCCPRPTGVERSSFVLSYSIGGSPFTPLRVDSEGDACVVLRRSERLATACVLTTNVDPRVIAGEAFGRLNNEETPSLDAIIWRARLAGDPGMCDEGGLLGEFLTRCHDGVQAAEYQVSDSGVVVSIDRPTASP
jgi:hypothetical protein